MCKLWNAFSVRERDTVFTIKDPHWKGPQGENKCSGIFVTLPLPSYSDRWEKVLLFFLCLPRMLVKCSSVPALGASENHISFSAMGLKAGITVVSLMTPQWFITGTHNVSCVFRCKFRMYVHLIVCQAWGDLVQDKNSVFMCIIAHLPSAL